MVDLSGRDGSSRIVLCAVSPVWLAQSAVGGQHVAVSGLRSSSLSLPGHPRKPGTALHTRVLSDRDRPGSHRTIVTVLPVPIVFLLLPIRAARLSPVPVAGKLPPETGGPRETPAAPWWLFRGSILRPSRFSVTK